MTEKKISLNPKQYQVINHVLNGETMTNAVMQSGYSKTKKSAEIQANRLLKSREFVEALDSARDALLLSLSYNKNKLIKEFDELYQQLKADGDASNAIKCLENIGKIISAFVGHDKRIKHEHQISFESLLSNIEKPIKIVDKENSMITMN